MATLTGSITDVTHRPPSSITSVTVKAPAARIGGGGIITTSPAQVAITADGQITIENIDTGLSWLYLEGDGWSDSIPLAVAEGFTLLVEAFANATNSAIVELTKELLAALTDATEKRLQGLIDLAKTYADAAARAAAAESVWFKGTIRSAVDVLSLTPGRYSVFSSAVAQEMGLPGGGAGELRVSYLDYPGTLYGRFVWETGQGAATEVWRASSYNRKLGAWGMPNQPYVRPALTAGSVLTDLEPGRYPITSPAVAEALGLPDPGMGILVVDWIGSIAYQRFDWWTGVNPTIHWRASVYNRALSSAVWEKLHPASGSGGEAGGTKLSAAVDLLDTLTQANDPTLDFEAKHTVLVSDLKERLGPVNVGQAGALTLVFDHGTTAFKAWVWPALKERGLTGTLALCPETHLDGSSSQDRASVSDIRSWIAEGLDIASHSGDHRGAVGATDIWRQIVTSKQTLERVLETQVDSWVQPGYNLSLGNYGGFGSGQTAEAYTNTMAGRLLQQTYPVITGYAGDTNVYPTSEDLPVGARRSLFEKAESVATVRATVQQAADEGLKHITFIHPYALGESSETYATKQDYLAFLDFVVQLRDAGKLKVLTLPQLAIAN